VLFFSFPPDFLSRIAVFCPFCDRLVSVLLRKRAFLPFQLDPFFPQSSFMIRSSTESLPFFACRFFFFLPFSDVATVFLPFSCRSAYFSSACFFRSWNCVSCYSDLLFTPFKHVPVFTRAFSDQCVQSGCYSFAPTRYYSLRALSSLTRFSRK